MPGFVICFAWWSFTTLYYLYNRIVDVQSTLTLISVFSRFSFSNSNSNLLFNL